MLLIFGGVAGIIGTVGVAEDPDAIVAVPILGIIAAVIITLIVVLSLPSLIAGFGLLGFRPWARILTLVLSALDLLNVPLGTIVGVYGLWVLLHTDSEPFFAHRGGPRAAPGWSSNRVA
jgi:hypothetical protein